MKWALRFLLWAAPLVALATVAYAQYLQMLAGIATAILAGFGVRVEVSSMDVIAPVDLALYAAMTLATARVPWGTRLRALALGSGILVLLEIASVVFGIVVFLGPFHFSPHVGQLLQNLLGALGWIGAPAIWLLLLGVRGIRSENQPGPLTLDPAGGRRSRGSSGPAKWRGAPDRRH